MEVLGGQGHHPTTVGARAAMGTGGGGDWDSFMGFSERSYSNSRAQSSATAAESAPLRTFPRSPRVTKASHDLALNPRGCRRSGGAGETGQQQEAGGAASAASLFGPMRHERPPPAATAAGAAALHALSNMKRPMPQATRQAQEREAVGGMEAVIDTRKEQVETVTPTGVRATLTTSAVLRFVEQLDKVQPPTDTEVILSSVMERMVEMVSLRCAGEGGLPEALDEHQQLCFATEQKQAEQVKVAVKMKKILSSKKGQSRANPVPLRAGSQRQRLQQAQAAAAWMKNREHSVTDAGVRLAEEAPASAGSLHRRRPVSSDRNGKGAVASEGRVGAAGGGKRRPKSERAGGEVRGGAVRGLSFPTTPRRNSDTIAFGSTSSAAITDYSYPGFAYPTANLFTLAGCGSEAVQKRVLEVVRKQNETIRGEKGRRRP